MDSLTRALLIIIGINIMLFLGQAAVLDTNPDAGSFYNCQGGLFGQFESTGCNTPGSYVLNSSNSIGNLPSGESSISPETGNIFTDSFTALKSWILEATGLGYVINLLSAPYNFLAALQLPGAFVFVIGTAWYSLTFMILVAWLLGRT